MADSAAFRRFPHNRSQFRAQFRSFSPSPRRFLLPILWIIGLISVYIWQRNVIEGVLLFRRPPPRPIPRLRPVAFNLTDFGGVGDGYTVNTEAFERAVYAISKLGRIGGGQLNVQAGRWLTGPFNLTCHMTLFLAEGAVILGIQVIGNSVAFSLGLATTLAIFGIAASSAGKAYGQIGQGLPLAASGLAILMGLNLLEVVELQLPSLFNNFDPRAAAANLPSSVQAYLAGLTFALAASPCSTPVLASILGYVAASRDPVIGGSLLLTYTTGYVAPLLLAASFAGALQSLLSFRKFSAWINPMSGALLLGGGLYTMLDRLFPTTMTM